MTPSAPPMNPSLCMDSGKVRLFRERFCGLTHVYGTYNPRDGKSRQVKAPVTDDVIRRHLIGSEPYGVYLLVNDRVRAAVADFDRDDPDAPFRFLEAARCYGVATYIERSKSKGYHIWAFFGQEGVTACKVRKVFRHILAETGEPHVEVFPKQDRLTTHIPFGSFVYAPLFGGKVPEGRTVFLDPDDGLRPYTDQWRFLADVRTTTEAAFDEIIEITGLDQPLPSSRPETRAADGESPSGFGLLPCTRRMLNEGVTANQRVACFRLAVHLKRIGLSQDYALAILRAWAQRNHPADGRGILTDEEITAQTADAYRRQYTSRGCESEAVRPFCSEDCPVWRRVNAYPTSPQNRIPD